MKINQIPYVIFQATSQFSFKFSKTPEIFFVKHYMLWTERDNQHIIFHLMRVHPIARAIFETTKDLFNFCITVQCHERSLLYIFLAQSSYFRQKYPIEVKFSDFWVVGWKFTKFLMSYLESQVSFYLNFASLFIVMRDRSSVLFKQKSYMIFTKGAHKVENFRLLTAQVKSYQTCTLIGYLLVVWRMTWGIWQIFIRTLESVKIGTFGILLSKVENVWAKDLQRGHV